MPMMTTTMSSSMRVKPLRLRIWCSEWEGVVHGANNFLPAWYATAKATRGPPAAHHQVLLDQRLIDCDPGQLEAWVRRFARCLALCPSPPASPAFRPVSRL